MVTLEYETRRLRVGDWHLLADSDFALNAIVRETLTPSVTAPLPPPWQGEYNTERAAIWIAERDAEGQTLLVLEQETGAAVGLVVLFFETANDLRLGYMLREAAWGKGYASELIAGLVTCCQTAGVHTITGGVAHDNPASKRVLLKSGFVLDRETEGAVEEIFVWRR